MHTAVYRKGDFVLNGWFWLSEMARNEIGKHFLFFRYYPLPSQMEKKQICFVLLKECNLATQEATTDDDAKITYVVEMQ